MNKYWIFKCANKLFKKAFWLYRPFYVIYKKVSDEAEFKLLKQYVKKSSRVIDIGANIRIYSTFLSELTGANGEVHAFEPDPANFNWLVKSVHSKNNVIANCKAVADVDGKIDLNFSNDLNVDHRTYPVFNRFRSISVDCITIDTYLHGRSIDLIKYGYTGI